MLDDARGPIGQAPNGTPRSPAPRAEPTLLAFRRGQKLELSIDHSWTLTRGEVIVYRSDRPVEVWRAPCPLDAARGIGDAQGGTFVAACELEVAGVSRLTISDRALIGTLAAENVRLWARIEADARRDDDTFLPNAAPVPGPWHFRRAHAIALVIQGEPGRLRAALPRGVTLLPGTRGRYLLAITRFEGVGSSDPRDTAQFAYHEVTPFVPVWSGAHGPAAFIPELYPDAWMAVILGREIHGFPKRTARIGFHEHGAELLVDRRLALRVRFRDRSSMPANAALAELARGMSGSALLGRHARRLLDWLAPRDLGFSALVHKRIGACESAGRTLAIDDVVRVPIALDPIERAWSLEALEVDLPGGPGVLHGKVLGGVSLESGFRFGAASVDRRRGSR